MSENFAQMIDHTNLKADATEEDILKLCQEAKEHNFFSVCVNPAWVKLASEELKTSEVAICTVVGFPLGASSPATKAFETEEAIKNGATEIDMVINIGQLKSANFDQVESDIKAVVGATRDDALVKVIIETSLLSEKEKVKACEIAVSAHADFVKTSTGFQGGGATVEDIALMRKTVGPDIGVKASGGIRDRETAKAMIEAGANRLGASAGIQIIKG